MRGFLVAYFSFAYAHTVRCLHSGVESRARRRGFQLKTKKRIRTDSGNYGNRLTKEGRRRGRGVCMCEGEREREEWAASLGVSVIQRHIPTISDRPINVSRAPGRY